MTRTPDQDAIDGLLLATGKVGRVKVGPANLHTEDDDDILWLGWLALSPEQAESLARVLQAWAGRRRGRGQPDMPPDPWKVQR